MKSFARKNYLVGHVEKSIRQCAPHHRLLLLQSEELCVFSWRGKYFWLIGLILT